MPVFDGFIGRVGAVSGAEPAGRVSVVDVNDSNIELAVVRCNSGAMLDVAIATRSLGQRCRVDTGTSTSPFVAVSIQMT